MPEATLVQDERRPIAYAGGIVIPTGRKPVSATDMLATMQDILALDYEGEDPAKVGLSKFQAGMVELARRVEKGDLEAIKFYTERIAGKPLQQINNFNLNADLKDFLSAIEGKRASRAKPAVDPFGD